MYFEKNFFFNFRPVKDNINGEQKMRKNTELKTLLQNTSTTDEIRKRRLQWVGHVRMSQNELLKQ